MSQLIFAPRARQDLHDILDYISRDKPIAAAKWINKIEEKCQLIATTPEFGKSRPEFGKYIRSSVVGRYGIFSRPVTDGIEFARVRRDIRGQTIFEGRFASSWFPSLVESGSIGG